jgi:hypothetical protein
MAHFRRVRSTRFIINEEDIIVGQAGRLRSMTTTNNHRTGAHPAGVAHKRQAPLARVWCARRGPGGNVQRVRPVCPRCGGWTSRQSVLSAKNHTIAGLACYTCLACGWDGAWSRPRRIEAPQLRRRVA